MWNHEHEMELAPGSAAARLFLGEPLRDATAVWLRQAGGDATLALECAWECRDFGHEPGPAGKFSQTLFVRFAGVAALRSEVAPGATMGALIDVRTKDTAWRRRAGAARHFRVQLSAGALDVLCRDVEASREDGRPFPERLQEPFPALVPRAPAPAEVDRLLESAARGAWPERAEALTLLGLSCDPRALPAARDALGAAEPAVLAAAIHALGFLGGADDLARLARLVPPGEAPAAMFRAHALDAVERILERAGTPGPGRAAGRR